MAIETLYLRHVGMHIDIRDKLVKCCICGCFRMFFLSGVNICTGCAGVVPSYIPPTQVNKYMREWIKIRIKKYKLNGLIILTCVEIYLLRFQRPILV